MAQVLGRFSARGSGVHGRSSKKTRCRVRMGGRMEQLILDLEAILFRHDPMGINYEVNTDEYRPKRSRSRFVAPRRSPWTTCDGSSTRSSPAGSTG